MSRTRTLLVIGAGPGIGRAVASLFTSQRYDNVALIARRPGQLKLEQAAVEEAAGRPINIKTYPVDVTDSTAFAEVLDTIVDDLGEPECVFYNAARVQPSALLAHSSEEIEYDFKISVSSLYLVTQKTLSKLAKLAKTDPAAQPALIVTSSLLPVDPIPQFFALSLVKAAQRNLVHSLFKEFGYDGVHIGVITVGSPVSPSEPNRNPRNIAAKTWDWMVQSRGNPSFEVQVL